MIKNCTNCGYNGNKSVCDGCFFFSKWISKMDYANAVAKQIEEFMEGDKTVNKKANAYNDLTIMKGRAHLEMNGNRYPVIIESITESYECAPEISGHFLSMMPVSTAENYLDRYFKNDVEQIKPLSQTRVPSIKNVLFHNPATIVFWTDGTKTIVKADGEAYDPEKGLAMAISKKALGNQGNYYNEFKKWLPEEYLIDPNFAKVGANAWDATSLTNFIDSIIENKKEKKNEI